MAAISFDLAVRVLQIILKHVVEEIPLYGRSLKLTVEIAEAIRQEGKRDLGLNSQELAEAVAALPAATLHEEAKRALGKRQDLAPQIHPSLVLELEKAPDHFASLMARVEDAERKKKDEERKKKQETALESERNQSAAIVSLRQELEVSVRRERYSQAYETLLALRRAGEWSRDLGRLERFLYKKKRREFLSWTLKFPDRGTACIYIIAIPGCWSLLSSGNSGCFATVIACTFLIAGLWGVIGIYVFTPLFESWRIPIGWRKGVAGALVTFVIILIMAIGRQISILFS